MSSSRRRASVDFLKPQTMAAAPPPTHGTATPPAVTYTQRYGRQRDALEGYYGQFLAPYAHDSTRTHTSLLTRVLASGHSVPKVFLSLVEHGGTYRSVSVHRLTLYANHPYEPSPWDNLVLGFGGDVLPGNHIELLRFPGNAFEVTGAQVVPTVAAMHALLAADPTAPAVGPFHDGEPDTQTIRSRNVLPVPPAYINIILDKTLTPRELWDQLGGAIIADGREEECTLLMQWMLMALTRRPGATNTAPPLGPWNSLGNLPMVYPVMRVDAALQHHRWEILRSDLPALDPSRLAPSDQMVGLVEALRTEQAAVRQEQAEARNRAAAPKEPSEAFPQTAVLWQRYCGVTTDAQLPSLYHTWANSTKAERRVALQAALDERVNSGLGASRVTPLATKELYELLFQARLASHVHEAEDLTKGASPFTCGYQVGERDQDVAVRAHRFDQILLGHTNPTLAEQETLRTKDLPLPLTIYQFTTQLGCFSTVLDVALGENHPAAVTLRNFCLTEWPNLEHSLQGMPDDVRPYLPSMLLWFHKRFGAYFRGLLSGRPLPVPRLELFTELIEFRSFHNLPPMPRRYIQRPPETTPLTLTPLRDPAPTAGPTGDPGPRRDPGQRVTNPNPVAQFTEAYSASGRRIADLRGSAPSTTDRGTGNPVDLCLSYHLRGACYANCQRASTHRNLSAPERRLMTTFIAQHLPSQSPPIATTPDTTVPPGPAPAPGRA